MYRLPCMCRNGHPWFCIANISIVSFFGCDCRQHRCNVYSCARSSYNHFTLWLQVDFAALEGEDTAVKFAEREVESDMDDVYDDPADANGGEGVKSNCHRQAEMLYSAAGQHNPAAARAAKKAVQKRRKAAGTHLNEAYTFDVLAADETMIE